jgi:hypothetical protein
MNIFFLDMLPKKCAEMHCNKHVVKMIIEYAQLLSTAHHFANTTNSGFYKPTHVNHPCAVWVRQSVLNYCWLYELFVCLCKEYTKRYKKVHLTEIKLKNRLRILPCNIIKKGIFTKFPQTMPDDTKNDSVVQAYRDCYCKYKKNFAIWPNMPPEWFEEIF